MMTMHLPCEQNGCNIDLDGSIEVLNGVSKSRHAMERGKEFSQHDLLVIAKYLKESAR